MTTSFANVTLDPSDWIDLCALYPTLANSDVILRYLDPRFARIVHGGAVKPTASDDGDMFNPQQAVYVNSDHIWVIGEGVLSVTIL
ncbi:MAG: hypothetical protein QHC40_12085 [Sphingobium sp.]|nr:hypothetical protein [Sphingobium sp.]